MDTTGQIQRGNTDMSFGNLKRNKGSFSDLANKVKQDQKGAASYKDERFWSLSVDSAGIGNAVIRFLPPTDGEEIPYVLMYEHSFKDETTGKWYIENCPTTISRDDCPCCASNTENWNSGIESRKKLASSRKRNKRYIANIYVVNDPQNPQNEGKVFLFKFGPKIFEMISSAIDPQFPDIPPVNPFDLWEGANFRLRAHKVSGQRSYDKSEFAPASQLLPTDEELKAVYDSQYKLAELVSEDKFKAPAELQKRFNQTIGVTAGHAATAVGTQPAAPVQTAVHNDPPFDTEPAQTSNATNDSLLDQYADLLG